MNRVARAILIGAAALMAIGVTALVAATGRQETAILTWVTNLMPAAARRAIRGDGATSSTGRQIFVQKGCATCHSTDGSPNVGPTLKGLYGSTVEFADGSTRTADTAFLEEFIRDPRKRAIKGFRSIMPRTELTDEELHRLIAYLKSVS